MEQAAPGLLTLSSLLRLFLAVVGLLLGDLDLRVLVRLRHELLAALPAEDRDNEDGREEDVPGGGDELLRGRIVDGGALRNVTTGVEGERVGRLGDADGARCERHNVCKRARS